MNNVSVILFSLFWIIGFVHLYSIYFRHIFLRKITKCLILPLLIAFYITEYRTNGLSPDLYIIAAFFFSFAGDVLLLMKKAECFSIGGISFVLSHICFISSFAKNIIFTPGTIVTGVIMFLIYFSIINIVRNNINDFIPKSLKLPMVGYLSANAVMNIFALMQLFSVPSVATVYIYIGALLFFYSDSVLFDVHFHKCTFTLKRHVIEMFAYILAECLICYGAVLIGTI